MLSDYPLFTTILQTGSYVAHKATGIEQNCVLYQESNLQM